MSAHCIGWPSQWRAYRGAHRHLTTIPKGGRYDSTNKHRKRKVGTEQGGARMFVKAADVLDILPTFGSLSKR